MIVTVHRRPWLSATKRLATPTRTLECVATQGKGGRVNVALLGEIVVFDKRGEPVKAVFCDWVMVVAAPVVP